MSTLLAELELARWGTAFRTYGNNHSTLVGLLVDWWISGKPDSRWALEGGPSFGYNPGGVDRGMCDAVLGERGAPLGIIEVEGTRYDYTIDKIGKFFASEYEEMATLEFAIFLAYAYNPVGRCDRRYIPPLPMHDFVVLIGDPGLPVEDLLKRKICGVTAVRVGHHEIETRLDLSEQGV